MFEFRKRFCSISKLWKTEEKKHYRNPFMMHGRQNELNSIPSEKRETINFKRVVGSRSYSKIPSINDICCFVFFQAQQISVANRAVHYPTTFTKLSSDWELSSRKGSPKKGYKFCAMFPQVGSFSLSMKRFVYSRPRVLRPNQLNAGRCLSKKCSFHKNHKKWKRVWTD